MEPIDIYIASPYSHPDAAVREARYWAAVAYAAELTRAWLVCYSPIVHSHPQVEIVPELGLCYRSWARVNRIMQPLCREMHVLCLPEWEGSEGIKYEVTCAAVLRQEITHVEPSVDVLAAYHRALYRARDLSPDGPPVAVAGTLREAQP